MLERAASPREEVIIFDCSVICKEFHLAHHHLGMISNLFHVTGKLQVIIWSMVLGFWLLVFGLRALGFGRLSLVFELRSVAVGLRSFVFEIPDEKFSRRL